MRTSWIGFTVLAAATPAAAQQGRQLGGHSFLPSAFVPAPLITTEFGSLTGVGFSRLTAPELDQNGMPTGQTTTYNLGSLSQTARLQVAVVPRWLALRASVSGQALSGINQNAALAFGGFAGYEFGGGATVGVPFGDIALGGSIDVLGAKNYSFNVASAIARSLTAGRVDASTLLTDSTTLRVLPGVQMAIGLHPAFGLWVHARYEYQSQSVGDVTASASAFAGGLALSLDLHPVTRAPIGLLVNYNLTRSFDEPGTTAHVAGGGVFYTGRPNLALGVEAEAQFQSQTVDLTTIQGMFGMRYYW